MDKKRLINDTKLPKPNANDICDSISIPHHYHCYGKYKIGLISKISNGVPK